MQGLVINRLQGWTRQQGSELCAWLAATHGFQTEDMHTKLPALSAATADPLHWAAYVRTSLDTAMTQLWSYADDCGAAPARQMTADEEVDGWVKLLAACHAHQQKASELLEVMRQVTAQAAWAASIDNMHGVREVDPEMWSIKDGESVEQFTKRFTARWRANADARGKWLTQQRWVNNLSVVNWYRLPSDEAPAPGAAALIGCTSKAFAAMHQDVIRALQQWPGSAKVTYRQVVLFGSWV